MQELATLNENWGQFGLRKETIRKLSNRHYDVPTIVHEARFGKLRNLRGISYKMEWELIDALNYMELLLNESAQSRAVRRFLETLFASKATTDEEYEAQTEFAEWQQEALMKVLKKGLTVRELEVVILHFGLNGEAPLSLRAVGQATKRSGEYVRQIEKMAMDKLRNDEEKMKEIKAIFDGVSWIPRD